MIWDVKGHGKHGKLSFVVIILCIPTYVWHTLYAGLASLDNIKRRI